MFFTVQCSICVLKYKFGVFDLSCSGSSPPQMSTSREQTNVEIAATSSSPFVVLFHFVRLSSLPLLSSPLISSILSALPSRPLARPHRTGRTDGRTDCTNTATASHIVSLKWRAAAARRHAQMQLLYGNGCKTVAARKCSRSHLIKLKSGAAIQSNSIDSRVRLYARTEARGHLAAAAATACVRRES